MQCILNAFIVLCAINDASKLTKTFLNLPFIVWCITNFLKIGDINIKLWKYCIILNKEINTLIHQGPRFKLIKSDSKDIIMLQKIFYFK